MQFKESEEQLEKGVEEKLEQGATAAGNAVKTAGAGDDILVGSIQQSIQRTQACGLQGSMIAYWWSVGSCCKHLVAVRLAFASMKSCLWVSS